MLVPAERHDRVLQRVSSVLLNSPATPGAKPLRNLNTITKQYTSERRKRVAEGESEVVPDSEEERIRPYTGKSRKYTIIDPNIIEISSDEEEDANSSSEDPFLAKVPGAWPTNDPSSNQCEADPQGSSQLWAPRSPITLSKPKRYNRARRIIESSSSDGSDGEGKVEMIGRLPERYTAHQNLPPPKVSEEPKMAITGIRDAQVPLAAGLDDIWDDSCAILTLNETKVARKPIHHTLARPRNPENKTPFQMGTPIPNEGISPTPVDTPSKAQPAERVPTTLESKTSPRKARQPRSDKKAKAAAEQAKRETYAQNLFTELNHVIFKDGLPKETRLNWNKRLLTTAGRAKWHRSRDGTQTTEIELAEKILDCEERIRNTLSHEMCHLASWLIDNDPTEVHGRLWKAWATRVMRARPEIEITTRHDYEISYPYEWECEKCAKIYGRFSKSIRTDECVCGSCKVGKLIPLFLAPSRAPKTPKTSRMAATKPQDSPCSIPRSSLVSHRDTEKDSVVPSSRGPIEVYIIHDSDSESDPNIQELTMVMRSVTVVSSEV